MLGSPQASVRRATFIPGPGRAWDLHHPRSSARLWFPPLALQNVQEQARLCEACQSTIQEAEPGGLPCVQDHGRLWNKLTVGRQCLTILLETRGQWVPAQSAGPSSCCTPGIPALRRWWLKDQEFKDILDSFSSSRTASHCGLHYIRSCLRSILLID